MVEWLSSLCLIPFHSNYASSIVRWVIVSGVGVCIYASLESPLNIDKHFGAQSETNRRWIGSSTQEVHVLTTAWSLGAACHAHFLGYL